MAIWTRENVSVVKTAGLIGLYLWLETKPYEMLNSDCGFGKKCENKTRMDHALEHIMQSIKELGPHNAYKGDDETRGQVSA